MAASRSRRVWLFDLDNTLHHASHAIFPEINRLMNAYIARVLGDDHGPADAETVNRVRLEYYLKYGVTMLGMVRHHGVDAEHFLQAAHDIDGLTSMIRAERGLRRRLRQLPGKKILLTNAPAGYAGKVLRHLRLHTHFDAHVPVEQMRVHRQLQPKPSVRFLRHFLARQRLRASDCVLVEDSVDNLRAARKLGNRTVLLRHYIPASGRKPDGRVRSAACVDVAVHDIRRLSNYRKIIGNL